MNNTNFQMPCQNCKRVCMEFNARFLSPKAYEEWSVRMDNCIEKAEEEKAMSEKRQQELERQRITAMQKEKEKRFARKSLKRMRRRIDNIRRRDG